MGEARNGLGICVVTGRREKGKKCPYSELHGCWTAITRRPTILLYADLAPSFFAFFLFVEPREEERRE